jgi:hypothetical protein
MPDEAPNVPFSLESLRIDTLRIVVAEINECDAEFRVDGDEEDEDEDSLALESLLRK